MKIGYLTKQNPEDKKAYSGTHFYMYRALQRSFDEVIPLGPVDAFYKFVPKVKGKWLSLFSGKTYKYQYDVGLAQRMSAIIDQKINRANPDVILASLMNPETAYLETQKPVYLTSDATFPLLHDLYESHSNLHPKSIEEARHLEQKAFEKATKLILPLQWLADSAKKEYGVAPDKIEVVPYGANLEKELSKSELDNMLTARLNSDKVKLLFVGVRWEEKGGPFAVEVLRKLLEMKVKAELWVLGCNPDISNKPKEVKVIGFLDKGKPEEQQELYRLYKEASFFIMPTKAECVGMSFIEAASFGLPAVGTDVGGVPEAVYHNETGFIITKENTAVMVAEWISKNWENKSEYRRLSKNALARYQTRMNWNRWGERVLEIIRADEYG